MRAFQIALLSLSLSLVGCGGKKPEPAAPKNEGGDMMMKSTEGKDGTANPCNPCASKNPCNPCAANPCAANPCAAPK